MLKPENCRHRQKRLLAVLEEWQLDLAVITNPKTVYYFSGTLVDSQTPHAFLLHSSGKSVFVTHASLGESPDAPEAAVDEVLVYQHHRIEADVSPTSWDHDVSEHVREAAVKLQPGGGRFGLERDSAKLWTTETLSEWSHKPAANLTPVIDRMRRQKDPDEVECIRRTVALAEAGLEAVKEKLDDGVTEYKLYSIYCEALVAKAQTAVEIRGSFPSGARAVKGVGAPTHRRLRFGDLFIIDTGATHDGYVCDFTRTFVVGRPTQLQQDAWGHVMETHDILRKAIRPGVPAKEIYETVNDHLDGFEPAQGSFWHHAGHGIGLSGWELPWLTPGSEEILLDREVLACEPALYSEALQGGIRLEHDYLITPEGVTAIDHFPMGLT